MDFENLRRLFDIKTLAGMGRSNWIVCPLPDHVHHNYTPSFSVYWLNNVQYFKCHGNCGAYGDAIDFIGFMKIPNYTKKGQDRTEAAGLLGGSVEVIPPTPPPPPKLLANHTYKDFLPISPRARQYILGRGLTDKQIEEYKLGSDENWLALPTFHGPNLIGIKLRNLDASDKSDRYRNVKGSRAGLWGYDDVVNTDQTVYVCKGEIAAMVMRSFGFLSCAPTGGEGSKVNREPLVFANVIVIGDNDPGEIKKETAKLAMKRAKELKARLIFPPPEFKDIDEWLLKDPGAVHKLRSIE